MPKFLNAEQSHCYFWLFCLDCWCLLYALYARTIFWICPLSVPVPISPRCCMCIRSASFQFLERSMFLVFFSLRPPALKIWQHAFGSFLYEVCVRVCMHTKAVANACYSHFSNWKINNFVQSPWIWTKQIVAFATKGACWPVMHVSYSGFSRLHSFGCWFHFTWTSRREYLIAVCVCMSSLAKAQRVCVNILADSGEPMVDNEQKQSTTSQNTIV